MRDMLTDSKITDAVFQALETMLSIAASVKQFFVKQMPKAEEWSQNKMADNLTNKTNGLFHPSHS